MSIRSRKEILEDAANADGATPEAVLMAALNESQEQYKRLSIRLLSQMDSYDKRLAALEAAVSASNRQGVQDIREALQNASTDALEPVTRAATTAAAQIKNVTNKAKDAASYGVDARACVIVGFVAGLVLLLGQGLIQWHFADHDDYAKRIMYNIEYGQTDGAPRIKFFDSADDAQSIYDNQQKYEDSQKHKQ